MPTPSCRRPRCTARSTPALPQWGSSALGFFTDPTLVPNLAWMDAASAMGQGASWRRFGRSFHLLIQQAIHRTNIARLHLAIVHGRPASLCSLSHTTGVPAAAQRRQGCAAVLGWRQLAPACRAVQCAAACRAGVAWLQAER